MQLLADRIEMCTLIRIIIFVKQHCVQLILRAVQQLLRTA